MYKPVVNLVAPGATFATIAMFPHIKLSIVAVYAMLLALALALWGLLYLRMHRN